MKKCLRKILIIVMAIVCACSVHISVSAQSNMFPTDWESISKWIENMLTGNTQTQESTTSTTETAPPETSTNSGDQTTETTTNIIDQTGTGTIPSATETTTLAPESTTAPTTINLPQYSTVPYPSVLTTVEPVLEETEVTSFTYEGSLSDLLEDDSAAIIVQTPTENFTLGAGLVVNNGERENDFEWQKVALVAAAVLFVVLIALITALLIQKSKKTSEAKLANDGNDASSNEPSGPVPVEVMTAERIAELLGTSPAAKRNAQSEYNVNDMTSEDSAAAIKIAALMGQLTNSYSDPLMRKYTEEPVRISPIEKVGLDGDVTAAQILEATDSMLDDITGNEKYASDTSGLNVPSEDIDTILNDTKTKICPECNGSVQSDDVFCHACGAYVG